MSPVHNVLSIMLHSFPLFILLFTTLTPFRSWVERLFGLRERNRKIEKIHNEEFHKSQPVADVIGMIKRSRIKLTGHVACTMKVRNAYKIFNRELKRREHLRQLHVAEGYYYN